MSKAITKPFEVNGRKYYPCASFEYSQHKFGYWCDVLGAIPVEDMTAKQADAYEKMSKLFCESGEHVHEGIMYFPYPEYTWAKEAIARYDMKDEVPCAEGA